MDIFHNLINFDLQLLAFKSIKHNIHRKYALEIITMTLPNFCLRRLLFEHTRSKEFVISKNDRIGLVFTFFVRKHSGNIKVSLIRKRRSRVTVSFNDDCLGRNSVMTFKNHCNELWIKILIYEFDDCILQYIRSGFSGKIKNLKLLITELIKRDINLSVYIDIPNYIMIL